MISQPGSYLCRQRPTLPHTFACSTIGAFCGREPANRNPERPSRRMSGCPDGRPLIGVNRLGAISAVVFALLLSACNRSDPVSNDWRAGGLYSTADGKGQFSVVKILVLEPNAVHVRVYKQRFSSRPTSVDPASLTLGQLGGKDSFSIGHLPLSKTSFARWEPVFITQQSNNPCPILNWKDTEHGKRPRVDCSD